jgi:hypothetical protein
VVATFRHRSDGYQRLVAAQLYAGPGAVLSGSTAAAWHGVAAARSDRRVLVEVPLTRAPRGAGYVKVRRTSIPERAPWIRGPLSIASPARAVASAARDVIPHDRARAFVIEAVQRRIVRIEDLRHELETGPRVGSASFRRALEEAEGRAWSVPEADLLHLLSSSAILPEAWPNPTLTAADGTTLPIPDLWFDDVGLAVQVHSRQFHAQQDDWDATVMADGVFAEYGIPVVGVTPRAVEHRPLVVLRRIEACYRTVAGRPRAAVAATLP